MSVGSFNVLHPPYAVKYADREGINARGQSNWVERLPAIAAVLLAHDLDVYLLQEVGPAEMDDLRAHLGASYAVVYARHPARGSQRADGSWTGGDGVALLLRAERVDNIEPAEPAHHCGWAWVPESPYMATAIAHVLHKPSGCARRARRARSTARRPFICALLAVAVTRSRGAARACCLRACTCTTRRRTSRSARCSRTSPRAQSSCDPMLSCGAATAIACMARSRYQGSRARQPYVRLGRGVARPSTGSLRGAPPRPSRPCAPRRPRRLCAPLLSRACSQITARRRSSWQSHERPSPRNADNNNNSRTLGLDGRRCSTHLRHATSLPEA